MTLFQLTFFSLAVALVCRILPRRLRWCLLLLSSCAFYCTRALTGFPFLLLTGLTTFLSALGIERIGQAGKALLREQPGLSREEKKALRARTARRQHVLLALTLVLNFGILCVLKYTDQILGLTGASPLGLVLPLGISFYTFQAMSYLLDVSGGKVKAEHNPLRLFLFISFFPQLLQGPISRHLDLAPQLESPGDVDFSGMLRGLLLILWGLMKKLVLADRALPAVAAIFDAPSGTYGAQMTILGVLLYSLQQYCDFSGGIDLVTGIAELMGVHLTANFRRPYFAVSLADFWRRWHITLGAWMRDYVFYPFVLSRPMSSLSKSLKGRFPSLSRTLPAALGNILVFLLVGLWHGATPNYLLWGLYNGVLLAIAAICEPLTKRLAPASPGRILHVARVLRTFLIVNIGWFFDRAASGAAAFSMIRSALTDWRPGEMTASLLERCSLPVHDLTVLAIGTLLVFAISLLSERGVDVRGRLVSLPLPLRWLVFLLGILCIVIFGIWGSGFNEAAFIYYKF